MHCMARMESMQCMYEGQFYGLAVAALCVSLEEFQRLAFEWQPPNVAPNPALRAPSHPDLFPHPLVKYKSGEEGSWHWKELVLGEELAQLLVDT